MTGLMMKDALVMRKTLRLYALFLLFYSGLAVLGVFPMSMALAMVEVIVMVLPISSFSYDEAAKWDRYAAVLPVGRTAVVKARYLFLLLVLLAAAAIGLVGSILASLLAREDLGELLATLLVCSVTALVILVSGVWQPGLPGALTGAPLTAAAFSSVLGPAGSRTVSLCLLLFAFSSILGWSYYGQQCLRYLTGDDRLLPLYRALFLLCIPLGAVWESGVVWELVDLCNALMALPNLLGLIALAPKALGTLNAVEKAV